MEGNERKMNGNERKMNGKERKMNGNERKMNGNERKMEGNERKMNGNERKMNGKERRMNGNERKMNGNERKMEGNERKWKENEWKREENEWKWKENECFPTSFCTTRPQNRRFVRGFRRFSWHVRKCHACDGICTLAPFCAALTMRFAKKHANEAARWCKSIAPATQNRRGHAQKTRFGATSRSRDKGISVLGRKSRKTQKTSPGAFPLGRELTTTRRRADDDTTTTRRRHDDEPTTTRRRANDEPTTTRRRHKRREHKSNPQTPNYKREPFATLSGKIGKKNNFQKSALEELFACI